MSNDDNYDRIYDSFGLAALLARRPLQATSTSTTDNSLVRWDGVNASYIQDSAIIVDDSDNLSIPTGSTITFLGTGSVVFTERAGSQTVTLKAPSSITSSYVLFLPAVTGFNDDVLDISSISSTNIQLGWGTGYNVYSGPSSTTDNAIVRFTGGTGAVFQDSSVIIDDDNDLHIPTGGNIVYASTGGLTFSDPNQMMDLFGPQTMSEDSFLYLPNTTGTVGYGLALETDAATGTVWAPIGAGPTGPVGDADDLWTMDTISRNIIGGTGVVADNIVPGSARNNLILGINSLDTFWYGNDNTIWGPLHAPWAEGGLGNVIFGTEAYVSADHLGSYNVGIGTPYSGSSDEFYSPNTIGSTLSMLGAKYNVAIGKWAGSAITTGKRNIMLADEGLCNITTGNDNIVAGGPATGDWCYYGASDNIMIYTQEVYSVLAGTTGSNNIVLSRTDVNGGGSDNIFINGYVGASLTGSNAICIGEGAFAICVEPGNGAVDIGYQAGAGGYPWAENSVAIGNAAGQGFGTWLPGNPRIDPCVAIGNSALDSAAQCFGNVAIGDNVMGSLNYNDFGHTLAATGGQRNVGIGSSALFTADNGANTTGVAWVNDNTAVGFRSLYLMTTGNQNTAFGWNADNTTTAGTGNISFGAEINCGAAQALNRAAFGISATGANSNGGIYFRHRTYAYGAGNAANWSGDELYESTSSKRFKTDIVPYTENGGADFGELKVVWYKARPKYRKDPSDDGDFIGLIAEDLRTQYPEYVIYEDYKNKKNPKGVNYSNLTTLLTKKIQECRKQKQNVQLRLERIKEKLECVKKNFSITVQ